MVCDRAPASGIADAYFTKSHRHAGEGWPPDAIDGMRGECD